MGHEIYNRAALHYLRRLIATGLLLGLTFWSQMDFVRARQGQAAEPAVAAFNERVKQYIKLRDKLEAELPKLTAKSQPAEIEAHLVSLQTSIIAAREGAKLGDIFTPDIAGHIRSVIKEEFKGERLRKLRETVRKAETKGVPLRANVSYPETKELIEMPPTLLLKLPTLPKQLHYHFVGRSLVLLDKEARLIVDYFPNAIP
jgi:hypothetical protein